MGRLSLRSATREDAERLFAWRNDSETRTASRGIAPVTWQEHLAWLDASLTSPTRRLLIAESDGEPVGTVRWDERGDSTWELSWTVAPTARQRGIGTAMVRQAVQQAPGSVLVAEVKVENAASAKIALSAGFALTDQHDGMLRYSQVRR
jgi:RimJ/RimL family protein N-acetyltransferase